MFVNILLGGVIFGYAAWAFYRFIQKSKQGKCAACSIQDSCSSNCGTAEDKRLKS